MYLIPETFPCRWIVGWKKSIHLCLIFVCNLGKGDKSTHFKINRGFLEACKYPQKPVIRQRKGTGVIRKQVLEVSVWLHSLWLALVCRYGFESLGKMTVSYKTKYINTIWGRLNCITSPENTVKSSLSIPGSRHEVYMHGKANSVTTRDVMHNPSP